jgi:hypothetical protein
VKPLFGGESTSSVCTDFVAVLGEHSFTLGMRTSIWKILLKVKIAAKLTNTYASVS